LIAIDRPEAAPQILLTSGAALGRKLRRAFDRGTRTLEFDRAVYGHEQVKNALRDAQHGKCAFCESKVAHVAHGDVEHFRPKGGFCQRKRGPLERPGYYWLAYTWENLLFACQLCNQRHKKNHFPLLNPAKRARSHRDAVADERPAFIDPASEDPAASLSFREEVPFPKNKRGTATIRALGLRRGPLNDARKERLDALRGNFVLAYTLSPEEAATLVEEVRLARDVLRRALEDGGEFVAMVRAALPRWERQYGVRASW
jgi:uncharacterized protein (TIGR02646 family)